MRFLTRLQPAAKIRSIMASGMPLGRITRASMARFAYTGDDVPVSKKSDKNTTPDIEDIIPDASLATTRKRKRAVKIHAQEAETTLLKTTTASTASPSRARKPARKPARKTTDPATGAETVTPPSDWAPLYDAAKRMRLPGGAASNAAVDTMGCERLADPAASPRDQRFHTLVALMLSSQTKDTTNAAAMRRLQTELPAASPLPTTRAGDDDDDDDEKERPRPGLTLANMLAVAPEVLNELIWAVGFHNNKTRYLKQTAEILRDRWAGDIPDSIEGLTSLPGVGPKMAHLCLSSAWGRTEGIGVDVHVHRITNLWGWHRTRTPEETRLALQAWLPRDRWREINWLLVGLGQTVCAPVGRRCGECDLGLDGLCKAADRAKVAQGRKLREARAEGAAVKGEGASDDGKVIKAEGEEEAAVGQDAVLDAVEDVKLVIEGQVGDAPDEVAPPTKRRGTRR